MSQSDQKIAFHLTNFGFYHHILVASTNFHNDSAFQEILPKKWVSKLRRPRSAERLICHVQSARTEKQWEIICKILRCNSWGYQLCKTKPQTPAGQFGPLNQALAGQTLELSEPFVAREPLIEKHWTMISRKK